MKKEESKAIWRQEREEKQRAWQEEKADLVATITDLHTVIEHHEQQIIGNCGKGGTLRFGRVPETSRKE